MAPTTEARHQGDGDEPAEGKAPACSESHHGLRQFWAKQSFPRADQR
jgi:hypothetical protein